ncbi:hypothetical protein WJX73_008928 [Symbiochloris irregularis]|uniref:Uncharacterized protein n=1 Tax=Symbiochloris irregularis TaxID=706552 RepID=A0AAW1NTT3_9CHLO
MPKQLIHPGGNASGFRQPRQFSVIPTQRVSRLHAVAPQPGKPYVTAPLKLGEPLTKRDHWGAYWDRYKIDSPVEEKGWVGKFKAFEPRGSSEADIRFQEEWFRLMKADMDSDEMSFRYIRKGGEGAWPRKGKDRPEGYEETLMKMPISEALFEDGFWHPHGRFPGAAPTRVVGFGDEAVVQLSLAWPSEQLTASKDFDSNLNPSNADDASEGEKFIGGCEVHFHSPTERQMLLVGYTKKEGGAINFHGYCWDPVFVHGVDPESELDIDAALKDKEPRPTLSLDPAQWPIDMSKPGTARKLQYDYHKKKWVPHASEEVQWSPPEPVRGAIDSPEEYASTYADRNLFTYPNGAYTLCPKRISDYLYQGIKVEMGMHCGTEGLKRVLIDYYYDGRVNCITLEHYATLD